MTNKRKYGGNISTKYRFWTSFCRDRTVLRHVGGITIPFTENVKQLSPAREIHMSEREQEFARQKIRQLIDTGCIVKLPAIQPNGWVSNIFLRPKKDGSFRLILNLKPLNKFIEYRKFKMPSIRTVTQMVKRNSKFISIDLKDAYAHARVRDLDLPKLQFIFEGQIYMYKVLPNGIAVGPRFFVQMTKAVASHLRQQGVKIVIYIDDTLLISLSEEKLRQDRDLTLKVLQNCGFTINWLKSSLHPSTEIEFLGFMLDSVKMRITLTEDKRGKILALVKDVFKRKGKMSIRHLAKIIGNLISTFPACEDGQLHYRDLEREKIKALLKHKSWACHIKLSALSLTQLKWWSQCLSKGCPHKSLLPIRYTISFYSNASGEGWGALVAGANANGPFTEKQKALSINSKELLAIYLGLMSLRDKLRGHSILCRCDNTTAVSCIYKRGSQNFFRDKLVGKIFKLVADMGATIGATHLAGTANGATDGLSRKGLKNERLEWSLSEDTFAWVVKHLTFKPNIDLFASHLNNKLPNFCAFKRDPHALFIDAFTIDWSEWRPYAFPTFSILDRCLAKIEAEEVEDLALIAPVWPTAPFYGSLPKHLKSRPILLPAGTQLYLPWDKSKKCPIKGLRLVLLHLCATCYAPRRCPPEWLSILQVIRGSRGS